jgi:CrcB protein
MNLINALCICIGASSGALLRWWLGLMLNSIFPTIPLGTLVANLIGGFVMGLFMACSKHYAFFSESVRLIVATGFLGALTTFSAFSSETVTLLSHEQYLWSCIMIVAHVAGTILATIFGIYSVKILLS